MASRRKAVWVSDELWERLMKLKIETRARSLEEVLTHLLGQTTGTSTSESTSEKQPAIAVPAETETQPNHSPAVDVVSKDQPTQPATSPAGTDVAPQARKRRWSFCPQCLNMYDHQGKCPYCGVDLIPLDTDENKKLYLKLKQERGGK
jgi:hypothetical protein